MPGEIGSTGYQARRFMGRRIDAPFEVIDYARPTRFAFMVTSGPLRPVVRMSFEPQGETTRLTFCADFVGRGLFRLLEPLVGRQARKEDRATFARLKANLETGAR